MRVLGLFLAGVVMVAGIGCGGSPEPPPVARTVSTPPAEAEDDVAAERANLSAEDRKLVEAQEWCVISTDERLGSMGPPIKLDIRGQAVFVCCKGCQKKAEADPDKTLKTVAAHKAKKAAAGAR